MKKLQILTVLMLLSTSYTAQATLVNGFSDIQGKNPRDKAQRAQASDSRIAEEMKPLTADSFTKFLTLTQNYIKSMSSTKTTKEQFETMIKAFIDLFRASKQLDKKPAHVQQSMNDIKQSLLKLNLPPQLKTLLENDTAQ